MALLNENDRNGLRADLAKVTSSVRLVFFTQTMDCETCLPTRQILDEVASLSDQVTVEEYNLVLEKEKAAVYGIERAPAVAIVGDGDHDTGIRYYGVPAGYESMSLVEGILLASSGENRLTDEAKALVSAVDATGRPPSIRDPHGATLPAGGQPRTTHGHCQPKHHNDNR